MPKILIPASYSKWLPDEIKARTALEKKINELKNVESGTTILERKNFSGQIVFTVDVNTGGFHRLLFIKIEERTEIFYVLAGIALYHDYEKALRGIPRGGFVRDDYEIHSTREAEIDEGSEKKMIFYSQSWVSLSDEQTAELCVGDGAALSLPRILVGPPGSGKSLVSLGFFQERVLEYLQELPDLSGSTHSSVGVEIKPLRLLFVSPQRELNRRLALEWESWAERFVPEIFRTHIIIEFKLPVELLGSDVDIWNRELTITRIKEILDKQKRYSAASSGRRVSARAASGEESLMLYNEFWVSSSILNLDFNGKKDFDESLYKGIGERQTTLKFYEARKLAYEVYRKLITAQLAAAGTKRLIKFEGLSSSSTDITKYSWVVADEMQNCSPQDLFNIYSQAEEGRFIGSFDSYQRADVPKSPVETFVADFYTRFRRVLPVSTLTGTYRLNHGVASTCNELIKLFNALQSGKDSLAYSSIRSLQELTEAESRVSVLKPEALAGQAADLRLDADFAVLTLNESDKDKLQVITSGAFNDFGNIFSIDQARGLQFSKVVVYLSPETLGLFSQISSKMVEREIHPTTKLEIIEGKAPRDSSYSFEMLSKLMVALSRSRSDAWICFEQSTLRDVQRFSEWLTAECSGVRVLVAKASTGIDWLKLIHQFISLGPASHSFALHCLITNLKVRPDIATRYIAEVYGESSTSIVSPEQGMVILQRIQYQKVELEEKEKRDQVVEEEKATRAAIAEGSAKDKKIALVKTAEVEARARVDAEEKIAREKIARDKIVEAAGAAIAEGFAKDKKIALVKTAEVAARAQVDAEEKIARDKIVRDKIARDKEVAAIRVDEDAGYAALTELDISKNSYGAFSCLEASKKYFGQTDLETIEQHRIKAFAKGWMRKLLAHKASPPGLSSLVQVGYIGKKSQVGKDALTDDIISTRRYGALVCIDTMQTYFKQPVETIPDATIVCFARGWQAKLVEKGIPIPPGLESLCKDGYRP